MEEVACHESPGGVYYGNLKFDLMFLSDCGSIGPCVVKTYSAHERSCTSSHYSPEYISHSTHIILTFQTGMLQYDLTKHK